MKNKTMKTKSICIGAGLVALDVVMNGNPKIPLKLFSLSDSKFLPVFAVADG